MTEPVVYHKVPTAVRAEAADVRAALGRHLHDGLLPFWERTWDAEHGGYQTNFDADGRSTGTPVKYLNTQARLVWWFAHVAARFPERPQLRRLASDGAAWLQHFWDREHGGWIWTVQADGRPLDRGKSLYGNVFAIYALATYAHLLDAPAALERAEATFRLMQVQCADTRHGGYYENFEPDWTLSAGGRAGGDRKGLDAHLHVMEAFTALAQATGAQMHRRTLAEVTDLVLARFVDPATGAGRNQTTPDFVPLPAIELVHTWNDERAGERPATPADTTSYGHNLELAWLARRALETAGVDTTPYTARLRRLAEHALAHGLDQVHGGVYRDGLAGEGPVVLEKEFWQQAEALVGFLDAYQATGERPFWDAFVNVWTFVEHHMIAPAGEWRTLLTQEGGVVDGALGNPWKVAYHSGRAVLESLDRLSVLLGDGSAVTEQTRR